MLKNLLSDLSRYRTIGIFGFGKEGKSFYNFAKKHLPDLNLVVIDSSHKDYKQDLANVDLIIKSPGISLYNLGIDVNSFNFTSMSELFLKHFSSQIVGITGTKGKSTLSKLLYSVMQNSNKDVVLCGNIGLPAFDIVESINKDTIVVMELSSHQLMDIKYSPKYALVTNLYVDHLDYYKNLETYHNAKLNIFRFQKEGDVAIYDLKEELDQIDQVIKTKNRFNLHDNKIKHQIKYDLKQGFIHNSTLKFMELLIKIFDIDEEIYQNSLKEFKTLPHRLEYVGNFDGIDFINDSISTIPQATIEAINILNNVNSLILGGFDRGIDYAILVDFLARSDVKNIILYSQTGKILKELFEKEGFTNSIYCKDLNSAIQRAFEVTQKETICLFSPAASSFDSYKNFEDRGEAFKRIILKIVAGREGFEPPEV